MPVTACQINNKSGYKWGPEGECYPYEKGNKVSEKAAHDKAWEQGKAIIISQNYLKKTK